MSKGNLRFRRLVPLFVPIGVCATTHDDGTASDVTIGLWRHNQQATNPERNGKPWFSLPKKLSHVICKWWYAVEWMIIRKYVQVMPWFYKKLHICKSKGHENFEAMRYCFGHMSLMATWRMTGSVRSLTLVGAGTNRGFGTDPIRNPTIWLVGSRDQVN